MWAGPHFFYLENASWSMLDRIILDCGFWFSDKDPAQAIGRNLKRGANKLELALWELSA